MGDTAQVKRMSQVVIEFVLMFVALALFIIGVHRIWVFFNTADFAKRQLIYESTRVMVGNPSFQESNDFLGFIRADFTDLTTRALDEKWVFGDTKK